MALRPISVNNTGREANPAWPPAKGTGPQTNKALLTLTPKLRLSTLVFTLVPKLRLSTLVSPWSPSSGLGTPIRKALLCHVANHDNDFQ